MASALAPIGKDVDKLLDLVSQLLKTVSAEEDPVCGMDVDDTEALQGGGLKYEAAHEFNRTLRSVRAEVDALPGIHLNPAQQQRELRRAQVELERNNALIDKYSSLLQSFGCNGGDN